MSAHASFIWSIADLLRGNFKAHQYGDFILPFTVLRRLDSVLADTKPQVLEVIADAEAQGHPCPPRPAAHQSRPPALLLQHQPL